MSRTALSKNTTYGTLLARARAESRVTTAGYSLLTDAYCFSIISLIVQRFALALTENNKPFYRDKISLAYANTAPYYIDCSNLNPYWNNKVRLVHLYNDGITITRTPIDIISTVDAEAYSKSSLQAQNSILAIQFGWGFKLLFGSSVNVDDNLDFIEFTYDGQPIINGAVSGTYLDIPDSLTGFAKEELVDYMLKYKGVMDIPTFQKRKAERIKNLLNT